MVSKTSAGIQTPPAVFYQYQNHMVPIHPLGYSYGSSQPANICSGQQASGYPTAMSDSSPTRPQPGDQLGGYQGRSSDQPTLAAAAQLAQLAKFAEMVQTRGNSPSSEPRPNPRKVSAPSENVTSASPVHSKQQPKINTTDVPMVIKTEPTPVEQQTPPPKFKAPISLECVRCGVRASSCAAMGDHVADKHPGSPTVECRGCDLRWTDLAALEKHVSSAHQGSPTAGAPAFAKSTVVAMAVTPPSDRTPLLSNTTPSTQPPHISVGPNIQQHQQSPAPQSATQSPLVNMAQPYPVSYPPQMGVAMGYGQAPMGAVQMAQMAQMAQMNQMNHMNQMNQMSQMNQMNQMHMAQRSQMNIMNNGQLPPMGQVSVMPMHMAMGQQQPPHPHQHPHAQHPQHPHPQAALQQQQPMPMMAHLQGTQSPYPPSPGRPQWLNPQVWQPAAQTSGSPSPWQGPSRPLSTTEPSSTPSPGSVAATDIGRRPRPLGNFSVQSDDAAEETAKSDENDEDLAVAMDKRQCIMCRRHFATRSSLRRHLRRHKGLRPYQCRICGKAYTAKHNLDYHVKANHPQLLGVAHLHMDANTRSMSVGPPRVPQSVAPVAPIIAVSARPMMPEPAAAAASSAAASAAAASAAEAATAGPPGSGSTGAHGGQAAVASPVPGSAMPSLPGIHTMVAEQPGMQPGMQPMMQAMPPSHPQASVQPVQRPLPVPQLYQPASAPPTVPPTAPPTADPPAARPVPVEGNVKYEPVPRYADEAARPSNQGSA